MRRLEQLKDLDVPMLRVAAVRLGLDVVPPHVLLALGKGPGGLAGAGAGLAADAAVDFEDGDELALRMSLVEDVGHLAAEMPVENFSHRSPTSLAGGTYTRSHGSAPGCSSRPSGGRCDAS